MDMPICSKTCNLLYTQACKQWCGGTRPASVPACTHIVYVHLIPNKRITILHLQDLMLALHFVWGIVWEDSGG